jgi:hypothetical protein
VSPENQAWVTAQQAMLDSLTPRQRRSLLSKLRKRKGGLPLGEATLLIALGERRTVLNAMDELMSRLRGGSLIAAGVPVPAPNRMH